MQIITCIKQVPDTKELSKVKINPDTGAIVREGVPSIVNPLDEYAVEEAIRIKEEYGGKITVITMGPLQAQDALIKCLSMGADEAILLSDKSLVGSDTLATAYALAATIRKVGKFDLILCGQQTTDGETGQVGPQIAENLGIPQVTYVNEVDIKGEKVRARRELESCYEIIECALPLLLTVVKGINEPRIPSFSGISEALEKEIPVWTAKDVEADPERIGLEHSPTRIAKVWLPELKTEGQILEGEPADVASKLIHFLKEEKVI